MRSLLVLAVGLALGSVACAPPKRGPVAASSAAEAGYAQRYPEELEGLLNRFDERQREAKKLTQGFGAYPEQVKDVRKDLHLGIIDRADQAGRGQSYAEAQHEAERVQTFFREEKDEINKKVGGAVQFVAKQKGCPFDAYGTTNHALAEAIDKQLEERVREHSEAHALIERYRASLKAQAAPLEKQADEVSLASFIVYVEAIEVRERVALRTDEGATIRQTADSYIQQERFFQAEVGRTPDEKKASEQRVEAMNRSRGRIDAVVQRAQKTLPEMDRIIREGQKSYADALAALRARLK